MQRIFQRLAAALILAPAIVWASPILDFSGGFAGSNSLLNFNGSAQIAGTRARLTNGGTSQAGTVWSKNQIDIHDFTSQFTFQITPGSGFADGFTFGIQRAGNTALGGPAGSMGYHGIDSCVALKFGTFPTTKSTTGIYAYGAGTSDQPTASFDMTSAGINLHNGHVFSVALSYNSATFTLHQVVTDTSTSATFTRDYTIDLIAAIGGTRAYVGFTGSTGGDTCTQDILTWSYSAIADSYSAAFSAYPNYLQLFPRNRATNTANVQVAGTESAGGFSQAVLRVYRNGTQLGADQLQTLIYSGGTAPFSFTATITAELAEYDVELLFRNGVGQDFSVRRSTNIVAGDVYIIQGQSNATTIGNFANADAYISPFVRTFGLGTEDTDGVLTYLSWFVANGGGSTGIGSLDSVGGVGQWGLVMGNLLINSNSIPVAILNGGYGGQPSSFFLRNDASPTDILTNYGRLLFRMQKGGLAGSLRSLLFYQGEGDNGQGAQYQANFTALHSDWLQDYPSIERFYVFQERDTNPSSPCGNFVARFDVDLRNRQRLFADQFPNLSVMSTNGLDAYDGCHYVFTNGYEKIGFNMARMLQRDLYNGPSLPSTDSPNPAYAVLTGASKNLIRIPLRNRTDAITFDTGAIADFAVVGASVSITSGTVANGILQLNLSGNATGATQVVYTGHAGPATGNWVANGNGIGLLCFIEPLVVDTTPPVITLLGSNPVTINQGGIYTEPGATATDNVDGNLTSSIVINASGVNTSVPGDYPVTYNVSDIAGNAATQVTRTVHVNPNGSPTANPQSVTTSEDTTKAITLTGSDPDLDTLTFAVVTNPAHGVLSGTAPNLTYTPATNYNGSDSFTFRVNDGTTNSNTATVSITITPVNDAPSATSQPVTTNEDTQKPITLTATDIDGDTLTFGVVTQPTHGTLTGTAPNLTYTPATNYAGPDNFTFKVNDGAVDSNIATISITVTAVNDAPTANPQPVTTAEDTAKSVTLTAADVEGDTLTFSVVTNPAHGTLSGTAPNLTYTPASNYNGTDSFTFKANDGAADSNVATVSITVTAVNDPPTADPQSVTTNEDTAKSITLTAADVDTNPLTYTVVTQPIHGALTGTAPDLTYTPTTDYNGPDSFTFKANDGTVDSNTATVSITVDPVDDAPTISDIIDISINEDANTGAISFTIGDAETAPASLTMSGTSSNTTLVPNANIVFGGTGANRTVTVTPTPNKNGTTTITVSVNDGTNTTSDTFVLTVTAVNDAPTADEQSVATDQNTSLAVALTGSDIETPSGSFSFAVTVPPGHGTLTGTPPNLTYNPEAAYSGADSFKFTVTDTGDGASPPLTSSEATVSITINGVPEIAVEQPAGTGLSDSGSTVDFGDVAIDEDNSHTFTIRNLGSANLTGLGITIDGEGASEFTITATPTAPVAPGDSTTFTIKFTPTALETRTATLHVASNDADENPFDIALTGMGITNLEAWRLQYFGSMDNSGAGADANDPDLDDLSNLMEFATGNDPEQGNPMPGRLSLNDNTIEFVYTRAKAAINDGLTFNVEWSDDLVSPNWNTAGVSEVVVSEDSTLQQVKASVSTGSGARRFLRLKVTRP